MQTILFTVYAAGAFFGMLFTHYLEWWLALPLFVLVPFVVMKLAEHAGVIRFEEYEVVPDNSNMAKAVRQDMTDEEAAEKYGWLIVQEMDEKLTNMGKILKDAQERRDRFASLVKGNP